MKVTLDTHVRTRASAVPKEVLAAVKASLTFQDPEDPDANIELWLDDGSDLVLPRGFARRLSRGCKQMGVEVEWHDGMRDYPSPKLLEEKTPLFEYQEGPVESLLGQKQGIYEAPPASGKTVVGLSTIARAGQRSLVIVNTQNLADQWARRAEEHLGHTPVLLGDEESFCARHPLVIATAQMLWARRSWLDDISWWDSFGLVLEDEVHHVSAQTHYDIVHRFRARHRLGLSATPDKDNGYFDSVLAAMGDVVHFTTKADMRESGRLVMPEIYVVKTGFEFEFNGRNPNSYNELLDAVIDDAHRNKLIVDNIVRHADRAQLVLSMRLGHLDTLRELCADAGMSRDRLWMLTGNEDAAERAKVQADAEKGRCVIFASQVADEGADIPRLDTLHLACPGRNAKTITQRLGRVERTHPEKRNVLVYDYADWRCNVTRGQFNHRLRQVYLREGYPVTYDDSFSR